MSLLGLNASNAILFYPHTLTVRMGSGSLLGQEGARILTCGSGGLAWVTVKRLGGGIKQEAAIALYFAVAFPR